MKAKTKCRWDFASKNSTETRKINAAAFELVGLRPLGRSPISSNAKDYFTGYARFHGNSIMARSLQIKWDLSGDHPSSDRFVRLDTRSKYIVMGRRLEFWVVRRYSPKLVSLRASQPPLRTGRMWLKIRAVSGPKVCRPNAQCTSPRSRQLPRRRWYWWQHWHFYYYTTDTRLVDVD